MDVKKTFFLTGNESFRAKNDLNRENLTIFKQQEREICDFDADKRNVNVENLFSDFEWYFASVWIDFSSSRNRHVSSIRLRFSSLVTTDHSNIVSFYNNLLLSKRSLFYSFSSSECLMILTSIIEKIGMRLSTCDHKVLLLEFYAVLLVFIRRLKNEM